MTERRRIPSGSPYEGVIGFSRAVRVGDRVVVSGTGPIWPDGTCDPDPGVQAERCLAIIVDALAAAGATPADVVRTRMYLVRAGDWEAVGRAHGQVFGDARPAATMVVVAALLDNRWHVEIEAEAILGAEPACVAWRMPVPAALRQNRQICMRGFFGRAMVNVSARQGTGCASDALRDRVMRSGPPARQPTGPEATTRLPNIPRMHV